ncbi:zinc finger protein 708-like [Watersipora subatra]|uniref:zinc finger protein 708-like n=1 Tax=Watersipora subatra TaxID=2589382 RepID=UPI00355B7061
MDEPEEIHVAIEVPSSLEDRSASLTTSQEVATAQDNDEQVAATSEESVLQLNLTGESLQKFARILHDKGLQTAEDAIQYFYTLHSGSGDSVGSTCQARPRGRPKGSRNKELLEREKSSAEQPEENQEKETDDEDPDKEPGTVLVDGVRKSTRRRKNPYVKSEYVPSTKLEKLATSDVDEDMDEWSLDVGEDGYIEEGAESGEDESLVDIVSEEAGEGGAELAQGATPTPAIRIIQGKKKIRLTRSAVTAIRKKLSVNGRRVGRPRRRAKEAVLFPEEEETLNCSKCAEHFDSASALRSHKMSAHSRPNHPYFCEHCDYTAMFDCDMKRHQLVHASSKQFKCDICDFSTNWERNLNLHIENVHSNKQPWMCDRCDLKIYNHSKVKQHQLSHNPNAFKCGQCDFLFETLAKRQWHVKNMHVGESEKLKCTACSYTATTAVNMKLHLKNKHNIENRLREKQLRRKKQMMCQICNKRLINEEQKEVHMQIHEPGNRDSLKPYYCTVCDARCADINQMVRHRAIHTENKPFECKHCDYKTRWKKDLKTHEMIHSGEKNVHCQHCDYTCYTKQRLRAHMIKHDESRHHLCPLCNMAFKSKQALRMHTMYHTGEAAFSCDICDFRTVTEMRLRKHKLRHTDERNYSCNLCGKRFKQPHHVTQHRDIVHLGKPSYRERKRIALQQSAAEALGSLNTTEINFGGQTYTVLNDDGSTTLVDLQAAVTPANRSDDTQYVMVETPAGYQYVAVVMPEEGQSTELQGAAELQSSELQAPALQNTDLQTSGLAEDETPTTVNDTTNLDESQILLSQATGVYYTSGISVGGDNNQSVEALVSLQSQ